MHRHLIWFVIVAFAFTWALLPAASTSIPISLIALCGPAVAAVAVAAIAGGDTWRALRDRLTRWRAPAHVYVAALAAPVAISGLARGIEVLLGAPAAVTFIPITSLQMVVFVLVVGEEIGWRGFLTPGLLTRFGPWMASAITGVIWALWHLPLFHMAAMPQYGSPFSAFVVYTIALSVLLTRLGQVAGFSVLLATLFHGAVNTLGFTNHGATPAQRGWANAVAYGLVSLAVGAVAWRSRR